MWKCIVQVADAVVVARRLWATLVLPDIRGSQPGDKWNFENIYDAKMFIKITANTILSTLAADYLVEKLSCYVSDDGGAILTFEAMAEAASFANIWVPFAVNMT